MLVDIRGGLPPVPVEMDSIMEAIHHERMVELMNTGFGIQFFQMRKENKLQPGSPLHYPIPGSQLEIMNMDYYTFGGKQVCRERISQQEDGGKKDT